MATWACHDFAKRGDESGQVSNFSCWHGREEEGNASQ